MSSTTLQRMVNQKRLSAFMGRLSSGKVPGKVLRRAIKAYIKAYKIDMDQFDLDLKSVKTFNQFFTRPLKPGMRTFEGKISAFSDGFVSTFGSIEDKQLFQVKGSNYYLDHLLQKEEHFEGGSFVTIYLSPADYHRVHMPFNGTVDEITHVPGKLFSVNRKTVERIPELYCRNERVILSGNSEFGKFHMIFVGAIVVGKIVLSFLDKRLLKNERFQTHFDFEKGDELGYFELGSTVILVIESNELANIEFAPHQKVLLGNSLY